MARRPIIIVQGGQWGSEAKGVVAAHLCLEEEVKYAVRTGAVNAGHTVYHQGREWKMQQLPTGFVNPSTTLVVGPGALVHPSILVNEVIALRGAGYQNEIIVDRRAGLHLEAHTQRSSKANRHHKMGATGKGCSEALVERISGRGTTGQLFLDWLDNTDPSPMREVLRNRGVKFDDTVKILNDAYDQGDRILLEGTQGSALDLYLGPYPYTTHKPCQASEWIVEAGLSPNLRYEICLVARTYPIRVAGNSGPMPREINWPDFARRINRKLLAAGGRERVEEEAILAFEGAVEEVAEKYGLTLYEALHMERWTEEERVARQVALSELHKEALNMLPEATVTELKKLFEMTTVTKKLRRIAEMDLNMLGWAVRVNRPDYMFLTFANYLFPELWDQTDPVKVNDHSGLQFFVRGIEERLGVGVAYVNTGAGLGHCHQFDSSHNILQRVK